MRAVLILEESLVGLVKYKNRTLSTGARMASCTVVAVVASNRDDLRDERADLIYGPDSEESFDSFDSE